MTLFYSRINQIQETKTRRQVGGTLFSSGVEIMGRAMTRPSTFFPYYISTI